MEGWEDVTGLCFASVSAAYSPSAVADDAVSDNFAAGFDRGDMVMDNFTLIIISFDWLRMIICICNIVQTHSFLLLVARTHTYACRGQHQNTGHR